MKNIVLVDDVAIANFIMKKMVSSVVPGATVKDFTDPLKAIDSLPEINPDIIFLDLNMPEMNGFEFLDAMKQKGMNYRVIILSSSTSDVDKNQAAGYANVVGYYVKPLEKEPLQKIIAELER
jgi:CheY-like chemotaxis protein